MQKAFGHITAARGFLAAGKSGSPGSCASVIVVSYNMTSTLLPARANPWSEMDAPLRWIPDGHDGLVYMG